MMFIKSSAGVAGHPKLRTYEEGYLLPVLESTELLFSQRHRGLLRQFFDLAELSQEDFDRSYGELLKNFMEFVQILPHKTSGVLGSLLNYGLARASAVFQKYCQLKKDDTTPLLKFAVFSAGLLKELGRVISNQRVILTTEDGDYLHDWNPFSGSMLHHAPYFKMYPITASYLRIETEATPLLARQLIPHDIFLWLSSDPLVFSDWLAALLGEEGVGSKQITWALMLIKREDIIAVLSTLDGAAIEPKLSPNTEHGEAFYRWLKAGIENGTIVLNSEESGVFTTRNGLFISNKVFIQFAQLFRLPVNFMIVRAQFGNAMGIIKRSGEDFFHANFYSSSETMSYSTFNTTGHKARAQEGMLVPLENVMIHKTINQESISKSEKLMVPLMHQSPQAMTALHNLVPKRNG